MKNYLLPSIDNFSFTFTNKLEGNILSTINGWHFILAFLLEFNRASIIKFQIIDINDLQHKITA